MILGQASGIEHLATGGTIDSEWSPENDTAVPSHVSQSEAYLRFLADNGYPVIPSEVLMLKDSRQITIQDKKDIARRVAESAVPKTEVTSGTYLMTEIGRRIQSHPSMKSNRFEKKVAMVAALTPLLGFSMSDGGFNLGMAHAVLESDESNTAVMGVVNGTVAPIEALEKDLTTATFESVDTADSLLGYNRYTLIPAGGTIDFVFNGLDGVEPTDTSFIPAYLRKQVRTTLEFDATPPILKDSRRLTQEDMDMVVDLVKESPNEFIVVTAGLIRIAELAKVIKRGLTTGDDRDRKVILTGSRRMLNSLDRSDAPYNLGYAHGKLGLVDPGVHIAVAGRVLEPEQDPIKYCYTDEQAKAIMAS